jgi:DNA-binding PadR family transcriptional regulator
LVADEAEMTPSKRSPRDPEELLPLKPIELLVLTMLSGGDRHGYGIRQDIVAHTDGRIALEAGNLYRHIRALQSEGLVDETEPRPVDGSDDERRIYYTLRPFGRRVLAAELERLRELMRIAEANRIIGRARA